MPQRRSRAQRPPAYLEPYVLESVWKHHSKETKMHPVNAKPYIYPLISVSWEMLQEPKGFLSKRSVQTDPFWTLLVGLNNKPSPEIGLNSCREDCSRYLALVLADGCYCDPLVPCGPPVVSVGDPSWNIWKVVLLFSDTAHTPALTQTACTRQVRHSHPRKPSVATRA